MEIGTEKPAITVEPLEDPFKTDEPAERPQKEQPAEKPEKEKVPA